MKNWLKLVLGYITVGIIAIPTIGAALTFAPGSLLIQLIAAIVWLVLAVYMWNKLDIDI